VTLKGSVQKDPEARQKALDRVLAVGKMSLDNRKRFEQFGIISGDLSPEHLSSVEAIPEVEAVEADEEKSAS
jgi:hypothetical protein